MNEVVAQPLNEVEGPTALSESGSSATKQPLVAVIGNPNTGKSTLFNRLTGLRQKVANYPGVTVERHTGEIITDQGRILLVDLPGTYSLAAHSPDELIAVDVLLGRQPELPQPDAVLVVVDASNLQRNLFLATQVLELGVPVVVALNMGDVASKKGMSVDANVLAKRLQAAVVPTVGSTGGGVSELKTALWEAVNSGKSPDLVFMPELKQAAKRLADQLIEQPGNASAPVASYDLERALIDRGGFSEKRLIEQYGEEIRPRLDQLRVQIAGNKSLAGLDAQARYRWIGEILQGQDTRGHELPGWSEKADRVLGHPLVGVILFVLVMGAVFQAVFSWATPLMNMIDTVTSMTTSAIADVLPEGAIASLLADGVVAGVGSVLIFLPQILILFAFIIFMEDTGYMARAAFMMDRLMRWCGLSGHSFLPMLSSFACAVPGIMGTRVIPDPQDRIATILAAPFMTCSARLPVYALLIAVFIPQQTYVYGVVNLQGLVLLGLYFLGTIGGVLTAFILKKTLLRGPTPTFLMELPPYRMPNFTSMLIRLLERGKIFLVRAGTVIFFVAVVVWALAYFPRSDLLEAEFSNQVAALEVAGLDEDRKIELVAELDNQFAAAQMEQSYLGRLGQAVQPLFNPLGWDWKLSAAVLASFPAREVVIAVLGTTYAVGADVDEEDESLRKRIKNATWPDGRPVLTLSVALGLMVFYAFCLQCAATVATIRRETNSWRWPIFSWLYMTTLGYLGALACVQLGQLF